MKKIVTLVLGIVLTGCNVIKAQDKYTPPPLPIIPEKTFNINDFGAVSDDTTDNTAAIQKAIDAAVAAGGGHVVISKGTYLSGPLTFYSNLDLHLDKGAILRFLPIDRYPGGSVEGTSFISGTKLHDISITGKGTIDGQGSPWWPQYKTEGFNRPRMIVLKDCDKILIEGVKLMNSPKFHIAIGGKTTNVTVSGITVRAPSSKDPVNPSHNTDACNVTGNNILIKNCDISTGDDNYTCGGGTSNVRITGCTYGTGHGVSIGSYTKGGVKNFVVENCTFTDTDYGIRIKTDRDRGGTVENMVYRNLTMENVGMPILMYQAYNAEEKEFRDLKKITPEIADRYPAAPVAELTPVYKNFVFQNIKATTKDGGRAGLVWGLPESLIEDVTFDNVVIDAQRPFGVFFAKNIKFKDCAIKTKEGLNKIEITNALLTR